MGGPNPQPDLAAAGLPINSLTLPGRRPDRPSRPYSTVRWVGWRSVGVAPVPWTVSICGIVSTRRDGLSGVVAPGRLLMPSRDCGSEGILRSRFRAPRLKSSRRASFRRRSASRSPAPNDDAGCCTSPHEVEHAVRTSIWVRSRWRLNS